MNSTIIENDSIIHLSSDDYQQLRALAAVLPKSGAATLRAELARAVVVAREMLPAGTVTVNSRVRFKDVVTGEVEEYVITWPNLADGGVERVSILAPIGTALVGYRQGDEVSWPTPGGTRRLQILDVESVADESLVDEKEAALSRLLYGGR